MNITKLLTIALLLTGSSLYSQTKMISYKSHSGSRANMEKAIELDLFSMPNSNLGAAPQRYITTAQLDSLIFLDDSTTIMVTSEHCKDMYPNSRWSERTRKIWKEGKDTVHNHTIFNRSLSEDSIRKVIKSRYYFTNNADRIVFVNHVPYEQTDEASGTENEDEEEKDDEEEEDEEEEKSEVKKKRKNKRKRKDRSTKAKKSKLRNLFNKPGCPSFIMGLCFVTLGFSYRHVKHNKKRGKS